MNKIKYFALFLASLLIDSAFGQLINTKPTANPDTCRGRTINVLLNDTDPNNEPLTVTKFNGMDIPNAGRSIDKPDTGTFIMTSNGILTYRIANEFYGNVYLTYYVNDGKGSSAKRQNGSIVVIRTKPTGELKPYFGYILRNNDSCKFSKNMRYWVEVIYDNDTVPGYIVQRKACNVRTDEAGHEIVYQSGYYYMLMYANKVWYMDYEDFIYISNNACKD